MAMSPEEKRQQRREIQKRYRERHRDEIRAKSRESYRANRDEMLERQRLAHLADPKRFRETHKRWRLAHPEKEREKHRRQRLTNPGKCRDRYKRWWLRNRGEVNAKKEQKRRNRGVEKKRRIPPGERKAAACERAKQWRLANMERYRDTRQKWEQLHPEEHRNRKKQSSAIRRAAKVNAGGTFTAKDIARLYSLQGGKCAGCGIEFKTTGTHRYHIDHIIPLRPRDGSKPGSNNPGNLQLLCRRCNIQKSNLSPEEWKRRYKSR